MLSKKFRIGAAISALAVLGIAPSAGAQSSSSFAAPQLTSGQYGSHVVSADFTSDGINDVAISGVVGKKLTITVLSHRSGKWQKVRTTAVPTWMPAESGHVSANDLVAADYNKDGRTDLAVATAKGFTVLLRTSGAGAFKVSSTQTPGGQPQLATGDLDRDGRKDIVVTTFTRVKVYWGPSFSKSNTVWSSSAAYGPRELETGDIIGDKRGDIVFDDGGNIRLLEQTSARRFGKSRALTSSHDVQDVEVGKLFGSTSKNNIVVTTTNDLSIYSPGENTSSVVMYRLLDAYKAKITDLNSDGRGDIVVSMYGDGTVDGLDIMWGQTNGYPQQLDNSPFRQAAWGYSATDIVIGDVDGNGKKDVAFANVHDRRIGVIRQNQSPSPAG